MLSPQAFYNLCTEQGIDFFTGVPDSLLKDFCAYITDHVPDNQHVIAANEGGAVALAAGHYLATGHIGLVYMQNAGQGNAVNPLLSLAAPEVYGIPMLLLVGWRGEPGVHDEPQHIKQGKVTKAIFDAIEIPYEILDGDHDVATDQIIRLNALAHKANQPVALIVQKGTFAKYTLKKVTKNPYILSLEETIRQIASSTSSGSVIIGSTGHISRELYEYRVRQGRWHSQDFLTIGSMGHGSQIALGIAMAQPERTVYCLDGDGAVLMHMGTMSLIGQSGCRNFRHIILNNGAHGSVGGQPTVSFSVSFKGIALACGYEYVQSVNSMEELKNALDVMNETKGPVFLEVRVSAKERLNLGRPTTSPSENKTMVMQYLKS
jgi:phosphonopyruvate decarboxylase